MKSVTFTLLLVAMLLLPGCVPISIHPCYTEQSEITLPDLPGTYIDEDGEKILRFTEIEAGGYNMHMLDGDEDMGTFETHFCQAGDQVLIDMLPVAGSIGGVDEWAQSMILPLHLVCGVELDGAVLRLTVPDYEAMVAELERDSTQVSHFRRESAVVFQAEPPELAAFFEKLFESDIERHTATFVRQD